MVARWSLQKGFPDAVARRSEERCRNPRHLFEFTTEVRGPILVFLFVLLILHVSSAAADEVRLQDLDLARMEQGWGQPTPGRSVDGNPLRVAGKELTHGVGSHASSRFLVRVGGKAKRFEARVGVDDEVLGSPATLTFAVFGDGERLWESEVLRPGEGPVPVSVDLAGVDEVLLMVGSAGDNIHYDHADWGEARFIMEKGARPVAIDLPREKPFILTPRPGPEPRLTGPRVFGARPGNPFLHRITATGDRPMRFEATGLPGGVSLDPATGVLRGTARDAGTYRARVAATNAAGRDERELRIEIGSRIALTPPLGWNSWNCWAVEIDAARVKAAADAMVASGLADHGWTYINIDDAWEIKPDGSDPRAKGRARDEQGRILSNSKFPDMKGLTDHIHSLGLKAGLYSSPGPLTCAGYEASYQHEEEDARRWAEWGFDYIKYDWCSYGTLAKDQSREELMKPYRLMREMLDRVPRDIVYSLCQYGMGEVWTWGAEVGGNCWRTTGDIRDTWDSMAGIGFSQAGQERYAGPGRWNDPDMLVVGSVGWGPQLHPSRLTPNEQYTHISLWCLLASPLLIGCDLEAMDGFTLSLLTNDEVLEVNQDPLGVQARRVATRGETQVWSKEMEDGSRAVGLFNLGESERGVWFEAGELGLSGKWKVRDLWRQKDEGEFEGRYAKRVARHGVHLVRVGG